MLLRRATATLLAAPLLLLATGCGDIERQQPNQEVAKPVALDKPTPTIYPGPTSPPPTTAAPTSAAPTGSGSASKPPAGGGTEVKDTPDNKFDPPSLEIKAGDTVTWTLAGFHSVTGGAPGAPDNASPMKGEPGVKSYKVKFDKPGTYPYYCIPHETLGMTGEIVVK
jgi:plastocyanin